MKKVALNLRMPEELKDWAASKASEGDVTLETYVRLVLENARQENLSVRLEATTAKEREQSNWESRSSKPTKASLLARE